MTARKHRFIRHKRRSSIFVLLAPPLVVLTVLLVGYVLFLANISRATADTSTHTDAIVVLTGGSGRINAGVTLLQNGLAGQLFISGVNPTVENSEIEHLRKQDVALARCCITVGHLATDTIGNAAETAAWMGEKHFKSLRLVTADYHMPRALADFRLEMPGVEIVPNPIHPSQSDKSSLLFHEYLKFIAAEIRFKIIRLERLVL